MITVRPFQRGALILQVSLSPSLAHTLRSPSPSRTLCAGLNDTPEPLCTMVFTQGEPIVRVSKDTSAFAAANTEAAALMQRVYNLAASGTFGVH